MTANSSEEQWQDTIYSAAEGEFNRDPDLHHETVSTWMTSAALTKLADILDNERPHDPGAFVRKLIV